MPKPIFLRLVLDAFFLLNPNLESFLTKVCTRDSWLAVVAALAEVAGGVEVLVAAVISLDVLVVVTVVAEVLVASVEEFEELDEDLSSEACVATGTNPMLWLIGPGVLSAC